MSFQLNMPPSAVAKLAKSAEGSAAQEGDEKNETKKREDYKKLKELEEARKAGTVPAMQDEHGKDINPHIPQYIMQAPWYFGATTPTLRHQRPQEEKQKYYDQMGKWFKKGVIEGSAATKYRKGACENCGAMTHKKKDCLERPRKIGAKYTGSGFAPDEHIPQNMSLDYDGKRDRWNGYDMEQHKRITEEFAKVEEAKKQLRAEKVMQGEVLPDEDKEGGSDDEDEMKGYADDVAMPGQKFESKQRITVRNLRIREDTAKYLYNLDVNSAYYDPKTRSMRDNPFADQSNSDKALTYGGDNFVRWSGDAQNIAQRQVFAWEAYEKGADVHLQADPTKLEILAREFKEKKEKFKDSQKQSILEKYGGEEHLDAPPKQLLMAQSEDYVEYSRTGSVIKGAEKAKVKSMYEEDVLINNHTTVWGSYWKDGKWGFKCCHSLIKESYCTGAAGKDAAKTNLPPVAGHSQPAITDTSNTPAETSKLPTQVQETEGKFQWKKKIEEETKKSSEKSKTKKQRKKKRQTKKRKGKKDESSSSSDSSSSSSDSSSSSSSDSSSSDSSSSESSSSSDSEDEEAKRERKIKKAMKKEKQRLKEVDKSLSLDERKRKYNSMYTDVAPTEEEMEAYKRMRVRSDDPMAHLLS